MQTVYPVTSSELQAIRYPHPTVRRRSAAAGRSRSFTTDRSFEGKLSPWKTPGTGRQLASHRTIASARFQFRPVCLLAILCLMFLTGMGAIHHFYRAESE